MIRAGIPRQQSVFEVSAKTDEFMTVDYFQRPAKLRVGAAVATNERDYGTPVRVRRHFAMCCPETDSSLSNCLVSFYAIQTIRSSCCKVSSSA